MAEQSGYASLRSITLGNMGAKAHWAEFQSKIVDGKVVALSVEEAKAVPHKMVGTVMGKVRDAIYKEEVHPTFGEVKSYTFEGFFEAKSTDPKLGTMRAPKFYPPFAFGAEITAALEEARKNESAASDILFVIEVWVKGSGRAVPVEYYAKPKAAETQDPFSSMRKMALRAGVDVAGPTSTDIGAIGHDPETGEIPDVKDEPDAVPASNPKPSRHKAA